MFHFWQDGRRSGQGKASRRLLLEALEDRTLLNGTFAVTNTNDSGTGSLRWAIEQANSTPGPDTILFAIREDGGNAFEDVDSHLRGGDAAPDVFVIRPRTALPQLLDKTGPTRIDGRSQALAVGDTNPFGPEVVLDGSQVADDPA